MARRLRKEWEGQEMVGILLPPSVGGALVNLAALLMGKVPVNLNYTCRESTIADCAEQCGIRTVVTAQAFLDKLKLTPPGRKVFIEEVAAKPGKGEQLTALAMACLYPIRSLERALGCRRELSPDDLATVIFSSGSTGEPKGVMLSHANVAANIAQVEQTFHLTPEDRFLGILPFFHSFGFTGTLCLPATRGLGVVFHPSPLDGAKIGALVRKYRITFLLTTPTFLQIYLRSCSAEDFASLRILMAGAEKLPERLADAVEKKFGLRPLEGYGCTECAPVVAANTEEPGEAGTRSGTVGRPMPGIEVRVVDPDTREPLPAGQPGLLLVRGPNVMQGYLGRPDLTAEVLIDDGPGGRWYVTGDIAAVDEAGFIRLTDRLSRFSKIGGEMVPHLKVEESLHMLAGVTERTFVVTALPDEKKGERLVVLHQLAEAALQECIAALAGADLPNLWKPRADAFVRVEEFPVLGTGKLDLRAIRERAREAFAQTNS